MNRSVSMCTLVSGLCLIPLCLPSFAQNLVTNGGFETPAYGSGFFYEEFFAPSDLGGWTVDTGSVSLQGPVFWDAAEGSQALDLSGEEIGSVFQDITTTAGQEYLVEFALSGNPYIGTSPTLVKEMEVYWGNSLVDVLTFDTTGHSPRDMGWQEYQYRVTGAGTDRLRFVSLIPGNSGAAIDAVRVVLAPVPEPGSVALLVGMASVSGMMLRRRRK